MGIFNIIGLILTLGVVGFIFIKLNTGNYDQPEKTQDLYRYKSISEDGLIELPEGVFRRVVEVEPVNMYLKTMEEQASIWAQFRDMLNSTLIPATIIIQSRHQDIRAYISSLQEISKKMPTKQLSQYGNELAKYLDAEISEKKVKDHRYYIVLETDPYLQKSEMEIPSETISKLASGFQKKITEQEAYDLAEQELDDHISIIHSYLSGMGVNVYGMNKERILEMGYSALNKDLSPIASYEDVIYSNVQNCKSKTVEVVNNELSKEDIA